MGDEVLIDSALEKEYLKTLKVRFRNYEPQSKVFTVLVMRDALKDIDSIVGNGSDAIKRELNKYEGKPLNLIPKKVNHDLKRKLLPKLSKLNKRTNKSVMEYLVGKLTEEAEHEGST